MSPKTLFYDGVDFNAVQVGGDGMLISCVGEAKLAHQRGKSKTHKE